MAIKKLGDVFAEHAEVLIERAENGFPFAVLVSGGEFVDQSLIPAIPQSFATLEAANQALDMLESAGANAAVAEVDPKASAPGLACQLHIRPARPYGSFP